MRKRDGVGLGLKLKSTLDELVVCGGGEVASFVLGMFPMYLVTFFTSLQKGFSLIVQPF